MSKVGKEIVVWEIFSCFRETFNKMYNSVLRLSVGDHHRGYLTVERHCEGYAREGRGLWEAELVSRNQILPNRSDTKSQLFKMPIRLACDTHRPEQVC